MIYDYQNTAEKDTAAIIKNFNSLSLRNDTGALWENFVISERIKSNHYKRRFVNQWFWRTHAQQEIDYLEESEGTLSAFEFKWSSRKKARFPKQFKKNYPQAVCKLITLDNADEFFMGT
mgnify:CR=1 FL=1